ncbi:MAG: radical SAM family heme chaperone HemW [Verrucomicrobia bacterium]|nr:radical SAM family heme chaperone HemW [Verrucomicrobiota bacterium]
MSGPLPEQAKGEAPSSSGHASGRRVPFSIGSTIAEARERPILEDSTSAPPVGLYVHVPFCASTCDYCAFYQTAPSADDVRRYLTAVAMEAGLVDWPRQLTTVFWGGGTPGLLAAPDLARLAAIVRERAGAAVREWTIELAPSAVTEARLAALREAGVTRISLGVQSFQPALLEALGRRHTRTQILRAYDRLRAAGFASINLDLMFALPGQTEEAWRADVREAVALAPDHLSTYCLTFEEDTRLWLKLADGRVKLDPEFEAKMYLSTWEWLAAAGYQQYEVSNFARPGHACLHNLNTWRMREWIGLGPSAASQYAGWRAANIADLARWADGVGEGRRLTEDRVRLSPELLAEDAVIFGLRMNAGVDLEAWRREAPTAPWGEVEAVLDRLVSEGLARREEARIGLTERGRLVADAVGAEIMGAFAAMPAQS